MEAFADAEPLIERGDRGLGVRGRWLGGVAGVVDAEPLPVLLVAGLKEEHLGRVAGFDEAVEREQLPARRVRFSAVGRGDPGSAECVERTR